MNRPTKVMRNYPLVSQTAWASANLTTWAGRRRGKDWREATAKAVKSTVTETEGLEFLSRDGAIAQNGPGVITNRVIAHRGKSLQPRVRQEPGGKSSWLKMNKRRGNGDQSERSFQKTGSGRQERSQATSTLGCRVQVGLEHHLRGRNHWRRASQPEPRGGQRPPSP